MAPRRADEAQIELFTVRTHVERLDPKRMLGSATRVETLWKVRIGDESAVHLVFRDRHGTYCQEHGPRCRAVRAVVGGG